jgi:hypothetical protein
MNEMNITSAQWVTDSVTDETEASIMATIDGQLWNVPKDINNSHYAEIMRQVEAGTLTIADAD